MHIEPDRPTASGPADRFTGDVWVDPIADARAPGSQTVVARVRFAPGARTAWHSHALGQTLHVTEGIALMQSRGGEVIEVRPGQTVYTPPGEEHWHGAAPTTFMEHLAVVDVRPDEESTSWLNHVTDAEYNARAAHTTKEES